MFAQFEAALFARLTSTAALTAIIPTERIKSVLPQDAPLPYLRARVTRSQEFDTKDSDGYEAEITLDIYSNYHGNKQVHELSEILYTALHRLPLALGSGGNFLLRFQSQATFLEPDGQTTHATMLFRALSFAA